MILEINDFSSHLPAYCRILGLDLGTKTIGLALSDPARTIASPLLTIKRKKFTHDLEYLQKIIKKHQIGALILGLPINMDGTEGPKCQSTRQFARNIAKNSVDIPISFWDERLSTNAIQRFLIDEADMSRQKRAQVVDKMAASFILQGALDMLLINV